MFRTADAASGMERLLELAIVTRAWPAWSRYAATTALVVTALVVLLVAHEYLSDYPFLPFMPVVMISSLMFDRGNGFFAVGLSAILAMYFLLTPTHSFSMLASNDAVALILFVLIGGALAAMLEAVHERIHRLSVARAEAERSAAERQALLREVAHRVQNNLQLLISMLSVQSRLGRAERGESVLRGAVERVRVMARIHALLFQGEPGGEVMADRFLEGLCADLQTAVIGGEPITIRVEAETVPIRLDHAVTLGLIISELVTNAIKYAFADATDGEIAVSLAREGERCRLVVADNGCGLKPQDRDGYGHRMIRLLVSQLRGELDLHSDPGTGTRFTIGFPVLKPLRAS